MYLKSLDIFGTGIPNRFSYPTDVIVKISKIDIILNLSSPGSESAISLKNLVHSNVKTQVGGSEKEEGSGGGDL